MKKIEHAREARSLWALALLAFGVSLYIAVRYASQLPLDTHSFRQTQTALTSYWFIQQGWQLAYQTPVAGAPWSIPFEFPIYQAIVAFLAKAFTLDLNVTGRMVSYGFLVLTILPVVSITRRLKLPEATSLYFCAILFSMPVYVYWSRTVMIETAALFFSIAAVKFFLDFLVDQRGLRASLAFIIFATLAILQKATTALPILAVLAVAYAVFELENAARPRLANVIKHSLLVAILFLIPLSIGYAWVSFTDHVKSNNPLGQQLTSAALGEWNWGTLAQRVSIETWSTVLWERVLRQNLGASLGMALLLAPFVMRRGAEHQVDHPGAAGPRPPAHTALHQSSLEARLLPVRYRHIFRVCRGGRLGRGGDAEPGEAGRAVPTRYTHGVQLSGVEQWVSEGYQREIHEDGPAPRHWQDSEP